MTSNETNATAEKFNLPFIAIPIDFCSFLLNLAAVSYTTVTFSFDTSIYLLLWIDGVLSTIFSVINIILHWTLLLNYLPWLFWRNCFSSLLWHWRVLLDFNITILDCKKRSKKWKHFWKEIENLLNGLCLRILGVRFIDIFLVSHLWLFDVFCHWILHSS